LRAGFFFALTFGEAADAAFVIFFTAFFLAGAFFVALADFMLAAFAAGFLFAVALAAGLAFDFIVRFMLVSCLMCGGRCRLEGSIHHPPTRLMRRNLTREAEDKVSKCTP
jgi:hypothetical protein